MNYLIITLAALTITTTTYAKEIQCNVEGSTRAFYINTDKKVIHLNEIAASPWNHTSKTYQVLNQEMNDQFLQGINTDQPESTLIEVNLNTSRISIGNIRYVGHHSDMEFKEYVTLRLNDCRAL